MFRLAEAVPVISSPAPAVVNQRHIGTGPRATLSQTERPGRAHIQSTPASSPLLNTLGQRSGISSWAYNRYAVYDANNNSKQKKQLAPITHVQKKLIQEKRGDIIKLLI